MQSSPGEPKREAWLTRCAADKQKGADRAVRDELAAHPRPTGLHVAAVVMGNALREGDQLLLGASNPVRDAALVSPDPKPGVKVLSNRGVAGIDQGTVSTAVGAAMGH